MSVIKRAVCVFSEIPTDLAKAPYEKIIFDTHTNKVDVSTSTISRDIILVNYGFITESGKRKLDQRIRKSIGQKYNVSSFSWR